MGWVVEVGQSVIASATASLGAAAVAASITATSVATVVAAASATALGYVELFLGGIAHILHFAFEADSLACQRMVEVKSYLVVGYLLDQAAYMETVLGHHRHVFANSYQLGIKFAIDQEEVLVEGDNVFFKIWAESLFSIGHDIIFIAFLEAIESFLQRCDYALGYTEDDLFGIFGVGLVHQFLLAIVRDGV